VIASNPGDVTAGQEESSIYDSVQVYQPGDAVPFVLDGTTAGTILVADLLP
jgi:hypothetical protein